MGFTSGPWVFNPSLQIFPRYKQLPVIRKSPSAVVHFGCYHRFLRSNRTTIHGWPEKRLRLYYCPHSVPEPESKTPSKKRSLDFLCNPPLARAVSSMTLGLPTSILLHNHFENQRLRVRKSARNGTEKPTIARESRRTSRSSLRIGRRRCAAICQARRPALPRTDGVATLVED